MPIRLGYADRQYSHAIPARGPSATPPPKPKPLARLLRELGKIASNINNLANYANMGRSHEGNHPARPARSPQLPCPQVVGMNPPGSRRTRRSTAIRIAHTPRLFG